MKPPANPAPTGLAAKATGTTSIAVNWTAPTTAVTSFILERATGSGSFAEIARPAAGSTSHDDNSLAPATEYRYRLAAVRSAGTSEFSAVATATTQAEQEPTEVEVTDNITSNTTWTADRTWILKGFIKVGNGATLTIEKGTRIVGDYETLGSSLFILRGARIDARGTAAEPIVFTSARPAGSRRPGDWGGLIVIGNGVINRSGTVILEGTGVDDIVNPPVPYSGGSNNADNSGTMSYVRVEYAGYGPAQDAELNSFTFAAVGSGTTLEYLQALNGLDDAYEWFGGAVDGRYLVSYETG
ncbi:MAG TPA: fibronectin type III domain-containing protein, partial [Gemmatimonadales bacterium]|nr:fibronectin type III domain-containing protein [Gemmatimonadales bacterium]